MKNTGLDSQFYANCLKINPEYAENLIDGIKRALKLGEKIDKKTRDLLWKKATDLLMWSFSSAVDRGGDGKTRKVTLTGITQEGHLIDTNFHFCLLAGKPNKFDFLDNILYVSEYSGVYVLKYCFS